MGRQSAENPSLFYPNLLVRVRLAGIFLPSYSLEQPGPRCAGPALFWMEVEKQLSPGRAKSTGKVPQDLGAPLPRELPKIQTKKAWKILVWAFPSSSRLDFPALTTTFDQVFPIIPTSDTKITDRLRVGPWELHPQRYSHWKSIPGAQPSHLSWKTAQPEQNHGWQPENQPRVQGISIPPAGNTELRFLMDEEITLTGIGREFQLVPS